MTRTELLLKLRDSGVKMRALQSEYALLNAEYREALKEVTAASDAHREAVAEVNRRAEVHSVVNINASKKSKEAGAVYDQIARLQTELLSGFIEVVSMELSDDA